MKIVFFGSSKYSVIAEKAIYEKFGLSLVITVPDSLIVRKKAFTASPVKEFAIENKVPVLTTQTLTSEIISKIRKINPDFLVVADFRLILPKTLLDLAKIAPLNVHHSLLPKYRGPSPAPSALLSGENETGVSIILMAEKVDTGDILSQKKYTIKSDDTTDSLLTKLNYLGTDLIVSIIQNFNGYYEKRIKQEEKFATYTKILTRSSGYINLSSLDKTYSNLELDRMVRAYYPWPGVWTKIKTKKGELRIKFLPGKKIQPEGKKQMEIKDFLNGYPETKQVIEKLFLR